MFNWTKPLRTVKTKLLEGARGFKMSPQTLHSYPETRASYWLLTFKAKNLMNLSKSFLSWGLRPLSMLSRPCNQTRQPITDEHNSKPWLQSTSKLQVQHLVEVIRVIMVPGQCNTDSTASKMIFNEFYTNNCWENGNKCQLQCQLNHPRQATFGSKQALLTTFKQSFSTRIFDTY